MSELNKALGDISNIRMQVARSTDFRGYGPATLAATGVLALVAATAQRLWLPGPAGHIEAYLATWIATAAISAAVIGAEMFARTRRMHRGMADEMIRMAVEQFSAVSSRGHADDVCAGALRAVGGVDAARSVAGDFQPGVFSSCRFLPRPMIAAGVWYLATGAFCISLANAPALSPWAMGIPYGLGNCWWRSVLLQGGGDE